MATDRTGLRPRALAPGYELFDLDGGPVLRTPTGDFLAVRAPRAAFDALLGTAADGGTEPVGEPGSARLLDAFRTAGYLDGESSWPARRRQVLVVGDGLLADAVLASLHLAGARPTRGDRAALTPLLEPGRDTGLPVAVVACSDDHAPGWWRELGDRLPAAGAAWQRVHREGGLVLVEPVAATAGDVLHSHVRARRLAASPAAEHLAAYWAQTRTAGHPVLGRLEASFVAAVAAADLRAWASSPGDVDSADGTGAPRTTTQGPGRTAPGPSRPTPGPDRAMPSRRRLRAVHLVGLRVVDHPVLPVPPAEPRPVVQQ